MAFMSLLAILAALGTAVLAASAFVGLCLLFTVVMGILLLVTAGRLGRSPQLMARHRALAAVCRVAGIIGVALGALGVGIYVFVLAAVMSRLM